MTWLKYPSLYKILTRKHARKAFYCTIKIASERVASNNSDSDRRESYHRLYSVGWGYTNDRRADKNPYPHDRRADKDSYPHDRNVTDDLCSLIKRYG